MKSERLLIPYLLLAVLFFLPLDVPYKLAYPVALLAVLTLLERHWRLGLAFLFSALGDVAGCAHSFPLQMGAFAMGHVFFVLAFVKSYRPARTRCIAALTLALAVVYAFVWWLILSRVQPVALGIGTMVYAALILTMLATAVLTRKAWLVLGAALFVASDFVLAYNRFVEHVPEATLCIMIPYYLAQGTIRLGAERG